LLEKVSIAINIVLLNKIVKNYPPALKNRALVDRLAVAFYPACLFWAAAFKQRRYPSLKFVHYIVNYDQKLLIKFI